MLHIYKIGGGILDKLEQLRIFLERFAEIQAPKILIHGGGRSADELLQRLSIEPKKYEGKRITDEHTLRAVVQCYAGELNKQTVAMLQAANCDALGLSGADGNLLRTQRRAVGAIDYGFVGDLLPSGVNVRLLQNLLDLGIVPVICAITHDGKGQLLNTNADSIAANVAVAMAQADSSRAVTLTYCFDKKGVLRDVHDDSTLIAKINRDDYARLRSQGIVADGMIPKLDSAFATIEGGVQSVSLQHALLVGSEVRTEIRAL